MLFRKPILDLPVIPRSLLLNSPRRNFVLFPCNLHAPSTSTLFHAFSLLSEVKWSEVKWSEVKWSEVKYRTAMDTDTLADGETKTGQCQSSVSTIFTMSYVSFVSPCSSVQHVRLQRNTGGVLLIWQFILIASEFLVYCNHLSIYREGLTALGIGGISMNHNKCLLIGLISSTPH